MNAAVAPTCRNCDAPAPGRLTLEYYAGRRRRYVLPLRLYLTASLLFFLAMKVAGPRPPLQVSWFLPSANAAAQAQPAVPCKYETAFCARVNRQVEARYGKATRNYGEHLVFALHTHAAAFFWGVLVSPFGNLMFFSSMASGYAALAIFFVFRGRSIPTYVRVVASLLVYGAIVLATVLSIVAITAFF